MRKHLAHDLRRDSILQAALEIFGDSGIDAVTMSNLSTRTGVSRQIVYLHFHNVDEVLDSLFSQLFTQYFSTTNDVETILAVQKERGLLRIEGILDLPRPVQQLLSAAFFCGPHGRPSLSAVQKRVDALLERNWIAPLASMGYERGFVTTSVYSIVASALECCDLIQRGLMTVPEAKSQLSRMFEYVMHDNQPVVAAAS